MRIISGKCKGRPLKAVDGRTTRPTTDKVKESLFNIIGPYFEGGYVLDLFAGSGGLALEALSRGAAFAVFVEKDGRVCQLLRQNIESCQFTKQVRMIKADVMQALKLLKKINLSQPFDYVLIDPPYAMAHQAVKIMSELSNLQLLSDDCTIICEHGTETILPERIPNSQIMMYRHEKYGSTRLSFYQLG